VKISTNEDTNELASDDDDCQTSAASLLVTINTTARAMQWIAHITAHQLTSA
jgi:hypothetical protein